jgi:hypothetical protein
VGIIDQVEISGVGRSSNWVWASYMQVASNQPFLAYNTFATGAPQAPIIANQAATNIAPTSAWLTGYLSSTGTAPTTVAVYYGTQDGGAPTSGLWQATNVWSQDAWAAGSFPSFHATPLTTDTFYYYRYAAWNSVGTNWAGTSSNVLVGTVSVTAPDPSASENGDTGTFRISRGATATNEPTTVFYRFTGSAVLNTDYTLTPAGTNLTLAPGVASADITVNPLADLTNPSDTVVTLELLPGYFAAGTATNASVTISNVTPPAAHAVTSLTWTDSVSGAWDSFNTNHWSPTFVPANGDSAFITNAFANNVDVDYAAVDFTGANALNALTLGNPTAGKTNSLLLGPGDTLQYNGYLSINTGGRLVVGTGGTFSETTAYNEQHFSVNGGALVLTGGAIINGAEFNVNNGAYTQTAGTNTSGYSMYLAAGAGQNATMNISGGTLKNNNFDFIAQAGNSTLNLSGGELLVWRDAYIGTGGGTHTWTISGGKFAQGVFGSGGGDLQFGLTGIGSGSVTVTQTAGVVTTTALHLFRNATYNLIGGGVTNGAMLINGTVNQTGGIMFNNFEGYFGNAANVTGVYNLVSGTLNMRGMHIGDVSNSVGTLTATSGVTITTSVSEGPNGTVAIAIGALSGSGEGNLVLQGLTGNWLSCVIINQTGKLQGWGTLSGTAYGIMNGKVIADGYGTDQTLNLTGRVLTNSLPNTTDKGWYARNHGKLLLAPVAVTAATTYNVGQNPNDAAINLVNSAQLVFTGLAGGGSLTGAVLAVDRPEASVAESKVGAWEFGLTSATFASCTLTIRYDATVLPGRDAEFSLLHWTGSAWVGVPATIDSANHLVTASNLTELGRFMLVYPCGTVFKIR